MYFYIYDSFLVRKKYTKIVSKIEIRLASLDIAGQKSQFSILKSINEIVKNILEKESPTIVVIGSDQTFCQTAIPMAGQRATLGFIPAKNNSLMANILGLPVNEYACDVISARRVEQINFGKINGQLFFSSLEFEANKTILLADGKYQIIPKKVKKVKVINLDLLQFTPLNSTKRELVPSQKKINYLMGFSKLSKEAGFSRVASNPKDDYLEVLMGTPGQKFWFFKRKEKLDSLFFVKKLRIKSKNPKDEVLIKVDQNKVVKTPAIVELANEKLRIIVGKDRLI